MAEQASSERAFPQGNIQNGGNEGGMSLRDYLAGQALAGLCAAPDLRIGSFAGIAEASYKQADAMLLARKVVR